MNNYFVIRLAMVKDINPFGVRMPPEVKEELEKLAEQNRRSLNAEIVVRGSF